jgi:hypothetical protein
LVGVAGCSQRQFPLPEGTSAELADQITSWRE